MRRVLFLIFGVWALFAVGFSCSGCSNTSDTWGLAGGIAFFAHSPNNEIEQIYYLGVFDPQEQVPPAMYRVRVHGQASAFNLTRFSSGWVQADLIDSLGTSIEFNKKSGRVEITKTDEDYSSLQTGRKMVMFGPEGFRTAPENHRLVIVMGSNPEAFFSAIDKSLGIIAGQQVQQQNFELHKLLFEALAQVKNERERLEELAKDVEAGPLKVKEVNQ